MGATHDSNIQVTITLGAAPSEEAGFGTILGIFPKATNDLDGDSVATFTTVEEAETLAQTANALSATAVDFVRTVFSQTPKPAAVKVGWIDLVGAETYSAALTRIRGVDDDFYAVVIGSRANADILAIAAAVEATRKICAVQSDESGFKTATYPAALTALQAYDRTLVHYHDTDAEYQDAGHLAAWLVYDPDTISATTDLPVAGVDALATAPTEAERDYVIGHDVNIGLPYGGEAFFVNPGVMGSGRPAYETLTGDWFYTRLRERVAAEKVRHSARGAKLTMDATGQEKIRGIIAALLEEGVQAGHFVEGQIEALSVAITSQDIAARRMRFTARAQFLSSGRIFVFTINLDRDALT